MEYDKNCTRQKPFHGRARPYFARLFARQIPFGASGVTPGHRVPAPLPRSSFCRARGFKVRIRTGSMHRVIADDRYRLIRHLAISPGRSATPGALVRPDVPRLGHQRSFPNRGQRPRQPQGRSDQRWPSRPIYCPSLTTFSTTFLSTKPSAEVEPCVETLIPPMVPLRVPLPAPANACKPRNKPMTTPVIPTREKTFSGRERPPLLARGSRQNPFGLRRSLPATGCALCTRTSTVLTCTTPSTEEYSPCLY